ncbi:hypothetical protein KY311_01460 [Candidatus Woesearchaeota archaeon]|nr:hypothetical protein [Candidatus Woesearchaeota archaeon]MBW3016975.1 hypothetical protein [Candidatus Woesearchaeota archaeon]
MVGKKRLTQHEEFQIMKLVLDKFLWLGFGIMAFGLYQLFSLNITNGLLLMVAGAIVLLIFMFLIVKEYEIIK